MPPHRLSRRALLGLSGVALVGGAGCTTGLSDSDQRDSPSSTATEQEYSHSVDTPESITVRNPAGKPAVRSPARSPEEDTFDSSEWWDYEDWLVTSPKEGELLNFSRGTTGVAAARDFIAATDLAESTLLVHQYNIGDCETRRLTRLKWDSEFSCGGRDCGGIFLNYDPTERDGDCRATDSDGNDSPPYAEDPHASEATIVRIPAQIQSYSRFTVQV